MEICCGERISIPTHICWQPRYDPESALPARALEPARWYLADAPAKPVALHQEFNAVTEAERRLDLDQVHRATREHTKSIASIMGWHVGEVIEREIGGTHEKRF